MSNPPPTSEPNVDQWMVASISAPVSLVVRAWLEDLSLGRASFVASQIEEFEKKSQYRVLWTRAAHPQTEAIALAAWAVPNEPRTPPTAHLLHVGWVQSSPNRDDQLKTATQDAARALGGFADRVLSSIACELQWVGDERPASFVSAFLEAINLKRLAILDYLQAELDAKTLARVNADSVQLELLSHPPNVENQAWWDEALERSYDQSSDCPDLSELRKPSEIRQGYQASPAYEMNRWYKVLDVKDKEAIGVAILASAGDDGSELVYMALFPEFRKQGLGVHLMRAILNEVLASKAARKTKLILAVDRHNHAAKKLYNAFNMKPVWNEAFHLKRFDDLSTRSS